MLSQEPTCM